MVFVMRIAFCSDNTPAQAFCGTYPAPLQIRPKQFEKTYVYICWMVFVMRIAFCSNTPLYKHFAESIAPPARLGPKKLTHVYLFKM